MQQELQDHESSSSSQMEEEIKTNEEILNIDKQIASQEEMQCNSLRKMSLRSKVFKDLDSNSNMKTIQINNEQIKFILLREKSHMVVFLCKGKKKIIMKINDNAKLKTFSKLILALIAFEFQQTQQNKTKNDTMLLKIYHKLFLET